MASEPKRHELGERAADSLTRDTYRQSFSERSVLQNWEGGVPLDKHDVAILDRCLAILAHTDTDSFTLLTPSPIQPAPMATIV